MIKKTKRVKYALVYCCITKKTEHQNSSILTVLVRRWLCYCRYLCFQFLDLSFRCETMERRRLVYLFTRCQRKRHLEVDWFAIALTFQGHTSILCWRLKEKQTILYEFLSRHLCLLLSVKTGHLPPPEDTDGHCWWVLFSNHYLGVEWEKRFVYLAELNYTVLAIALIHNLVRTCGYQVVTTNQNNASAITIAKWTKEKIKFVIPDVFLLSARRTDKVFPQQSGK